MEERERQAKRENDRIVEQAQYRVAIKRKLRQIGIPSCLIRNTSTGVLETLYSKLK